MPNINMNERGEMFVIFFLSRLNLVVYGLFFIFFPKYLEMSEFKLNLCDIKMILLVKLLNN